MSPDQSDPIEHTFERDDEEDYDLLTYSEAGVRLQDEIKAQRDRVDALTGGDPDALAVAEKRLEVLLEGARRHGRQRISDENFEKFFGYVGKPRRLTDEK
jgi:hypothetical protein